MPRTRPSVSLIAAACLAACTPPLAPAPSPSRGDLLIRHARLVDGTGSPCRLGDVLIAGDCIAAIGSLPGATARDTIDATGLVVAPGFIDMLGHSEYPLLRDGRAISKITQGITSDITGEVTSVTPVNANTLKELDSATAASVTWTDLDGYFTALETAKPAINLGTFVTVGSVRRYVMGDAARPADSEIGQMRALVDASMRQGAMGLSSGMIYAPASFATTDEVVALASTAAKYGGGYASHIRSEGDRLVEAVNEAITIGERGGTWVQVHHLKASGAKNWGKVRDAVAAIEVARARGVDDSADQQDCVDPSR